MRRVMGRVMRGAMRGERMVAFKRDMTKGDKTRRDETITRYPDADKNTEPMEYLDPARNTPSSYDASRNPGNVSKRVPAEGLSRHLPTSARRPRSPAKPRDRFPNSGTSSDSPEPQGNTRESGDHGPFRDLVIGRPSWTPINRHGQRGLKGRRFSRSRCEKKMMCTLG